jgi:hypothetical protein
MNGDDDEDVDIWKEVMTPPEILESITLGCIETLRRSRVCFFPGPHQPVGPGDLTDFGQCLPYLSDCNALIFCAPHHGKEEARARIQHYVYGGAFDLIFDRNGCVGTDPVDNAWVWKDDLLFPHKTDNLLVGRPVPNAEPQPTRPPDSQFWAHYSVLDMIGRDEKLHLLHLGLRGDHAWLYFLAPHGIHVARMIADPV